MKDTEHLKNTIKLFENLKTEAELAYERDYTAVPSEYRPDELDRKIMRCKAVLKVYEYFTDKLNGKEKLMLGKYLGIYMSLYVEDLRFGLYLADNEIEGKLYDYVFGSHSGINEFFQDHFVDIISVILGRTGYSHALGSYDLKDVFSFFERFGYRNYQNKTLWFEQSEFDSQIETAKKIIDRLFGMCENAELTGDIDKVLATFFDVVFKNNAEE